MVSIYELRKKNLQEVIFDRFKGNKAAFSRKADVHPNHTNLVLSDNPEHRRNIGEELARRIESSIGLPPMWLDGDRTGNHAAAVTIGAHAIADNLATVIKDSPVMSLTATSLWLAGLTAEATAVENIFMASVAGAELAPELMSGDVVLVDGAVKSFVSDGVYLLTSGKSAFTRRVRKTVSGGYVLSSRGQDETVETLAGIKIVGRILRKLDLKPVL